MSAARIWAAQLVEDVLPRSPAEQRELLNTALRPTERRRSPELSDFPLHLCEIRKDQGESEMKKRFLHCS